MFESNHNIEMLMQTARPVFVKQRIINDMGHLCNEDSAYVLSQVIGDKTKEIVLAHISQEGNHRHDFQALVGFHIIGILTLQLCAGKCRQRIKHFQL